MVLFPGENPVECKWRGSAGSRPCDQSPPKLYTEELGKTNIDKHSSYQNSPLDLFKLDNCPYTQSALTSSSPVHSHPTVRLGNPMAGAPVTNWLVLHSNSTGLNVAAQAGWATSDLFHEHFIQRHPPSGLLQNPVTRRALTVRGWPQPTATGASWSSPGLTHE